MVYKITLRPIGTKKSLHTVHYVEGAVGMTYAAFQIGWTARQTYGSLGLVSSHTESMGDTVRTVWSTTKDGVTEPRFSADMEEVEKMPSHFSPA